MGFVGVRDGIRSTRGVMVERQPALFLYSTRCLNIPAKIPILIPAIAGRDSRALDKGWHLALHAPT